MADDPRVQQLLDELFDSHATPEEVCGSCPELLPVVRERWRLMCRIRADLDALFPPPDDPTPRPTRRMALPQIPGYEIDTVLGRGGMGVVFRARHLRLNRTVALKMMLAGAYAGQREQARFQREAEAVARLRHPNVVQVHDAGELEGRPYFTMELVEGGTLARKLAGTPLPAQPAAQTTATLAGAVQAAHACGIVHRDLKPGNVLLTADGTPKISDFGLARRLGDGAGVTQTGVAVGTPSYMAPEQARGLHDAVGPAVDVYALGAILYELLTGRPPFKGESAAETVHQVIFQDPVAPSLLSPKVPRDLETVCLKCLQKDATRRYATAAALGDDLGRYLRGEAIAARPEGPLERLARRVRHRPALSAAVAAVVVLAGTLVGGGVWYFLERAAVEAERAAAGAEREAEKRAAEAELSATERAARADIAEMVRHLNASRWHEARAALERARGRLGDRDSTELHRQLDQGNRDLALSALLDDIRLESITSYWGRPGHVSTPARYQATFREAGFGNVLDPADDVAARIAASNIRGALLDALDEWSRWADPDSKAWILEVARKADPDPTGWRGRARDPALRADDAALSEFVATAPVEDQPVALLLSLVWDLPRRSLTRLAFLKRIQKVNPDNFWCSEMLGREAVHAGKYEEAIGYGLAALAVRPTAMIHTNLGTVLSLIGRNSEALDHYKLAIKVDPKSLYPRICRGILLFDLRRYDDALADFQACFETREIDGRGVHFNENRPYSNRAIVHTHIGLALEFKGHRDQAILQYQEALKADPTYPPAQQYLRNALLRQGRGAEARVAWTQALEADPPEHAAW
jgi:serine/threonine-protein kinase